MKPVRIALVSDWFLPRLGGIELQVHDLAAALRAQGHAPSVVTTTPGVGGPGLLRLDVARLPGAGVAIDPMLVSRLRRTLAGHDVVHAHVSVVSPLAYSAVLAARALRVPCVVTFHSVLHAKARLLALADRAFGWRRWDVVPTAVSGHVARQLERAMPALQVEVLPNGVHRSTWAAPRREAHGVPHVVSAMRLHRKKRPAALVDAFARALEATGVRARLTVFGEGPERRRLETQVARRGLGDVVAFPGTRTRGELAGAYASADLFALPAAREAFGIAALEARCAGLPVLAMGGCGVTDFLAHERNAILARDDAGFAAGMARLLVDAPLRSRLGGGADDTLAYDWPRVVARHLELYVRAIEGAGSAAPSPAADEVTARRAAI